MSKDKTAIQEFKKKFNIEVDDFTDYAFIEGCIKNNEITISEATAVGYNDWSSINELIEVDTSANTKTMVTVRYLQPNIGYYVTKMPLLDLMVSNEEITKEALEVLLRRDGVETEELVNAMLGCTDAGKMHVMAEKLIEMDYVLDEKLTEKLINGFQKEHKFLLLNAKAIPIKAKGWFSDGQNYLEKYKDDLPFISAYIIKNIHNHDVAKWFKEHITSLKKDDLYDFLESISGSEKYPAALSMIMEVMATNKNSNLAVLKGLLLLKEKDINASMLENAMSKCKDPKKFKALLDKFIELGFTLTDTTVAKKLTFSEFAEYKFTLLNSGKVNTEVAKVLLNSLVKNHITDDFPSEKYDSVVENLVRAGIITIADATAFGWDNYEEINSLISKDVKAKVDSVITIRTEERIGLDQVTNYNTETKTLLSFAVENEDMTTKTLRIILNREVSADLLMRVMADCKDKDKMLLMATKLSTLECTVSPKLANILKQSFKESYDALLLSQHISSQTSKGYFTGFYSELNEYITNNDIDFLKEFIATNRQNLTKDEVILLDKYVKEHDAAEEKKQIKVLEDNIEGIRGLFEEKVDTGSGKIVSVKEAAVQSSVITDEPTKQTAQSTVLQSILGVTISDVQPPKIPQSPNTYSRKIENKKSTEELQSDLSKVIREHIASKLLEDIDIGDVSEIYMKTLLAEAAHVFKEANNIDSSVEIKINSKLSDKIENEFIKVFSCINILESNKKAGLAETVKLYQESDKAIEKAVKLAVEGIEQSWKDKITKSSADESRSK